MRRALAVLLQAVFSISLIGPALSSQNPDSNLPPCCRHNGKHHCAMQGPESTAGVALVSAKCSLYTGISKVAGERVTILPGCSRRAAAAPISCPVLRAPAPAPRSSLKRTLPQRGPPTFES